MRLKISRDVLAGIRAAAAAALPREACGLLFGDEGSIDGWQIADNVAACPETEFEIDPSALFAALRAERAGGRRLIGYWHSHPTGDVWPSSRDRDAAQDDGRIWVIVAGEDVAAWRTSTSVMYDWNEHDVVEKDGYLLAVPRAASGVKIKGFDHIPLATGEIRHLVPRSKSDVDLVPMIVEVGYPAIAPILDELIKWTADPSWPICAPLIDYLATLGEPMVEPIRRVLRGADGGHKWMCIHCIVSVLPPTAQARLRDDLQRLVEQPSEADLTEEVDIEARKILSALPK
jgi:proteasome lid subunit RPN8/RPN11